MAAVTALDSRNQRPLEELNGAFVLLGAARDLNVPMFRRWPVRGSFFSEYSR
jgi:hypothetical protein